MAMKVTEVRFKKRNVVRTYLKMTQSLLNVVTTQTIFPGPTGNSRYSRGKKNYIWGVKKRETAEQWAGRESIRALCAEQTERNNVPLVGHNCHNRHQYSPPHAIDPLIWTHTWNKVLRSADPVTFIHPPGKTHKAYTARSSRTHTDGNCK